MEYSIYKIPHKWYQKGYFWTVYELGHPGYQCGYTWTRRGAVAEAELYIDKVNDKYGRFF